MAPLVSAVVANLAALVFWVPQDVIKERQQVLQQSRAAMPTYVTRKVKPHRPHVA